MSMLGSDVGRRPVRRPARVTPASTVTIDGVTIEHSTSRDGEVLHFVTVRVDGYTGHAHTGNARDAALAAVGKLRDSDAAYAPDDVEDAARAVVKSHFR